jgi:hypothetical protein
MVTIEQEAEEIAQHGMHLMKSMGSNPFPSSSLLLRQK